MKEKQFQTELVKSAEALDGLGIKINPAWTKGVSDLYLAIRDHGAAWVECKIVKKKLKMKEGQILNADPAIQIDLTPLQRLRIKKFRAVGLVAGWCAAYQMNGEWYAIFGVDPEAFRVVPTTSNNIIMKKKGGKWDVDYLIDRLRGLCEGKCVPDEYERTKVEKIRSVK